MTDNTQRFLEALADCGYDIVAVCVENEDVPQSMGHPFSNSYAHAWRAGNPRDGQPQRDGDPAIWLCARWAEVYGGCASGHGCQVKKEIMSTGVWRLVGDRWKKDRKKKGASQ